MKVNGRTATPEETRRTGTGLIIAGLVTVLLMGGVTLLVGQLGPQRGDWPTTSGVVTANEQGSAVDVDSPGPDVEYQRVVTYTVDGQEYATAMGGERSREYPVGEEVTVAYNPQNPAEAELAGETGLILLGVGGGGSLIGLIFVVIGVVVRRSVR